MAFKYIMFRHKDREFPIIFPSTMVHSMVADAIKQYFIAEAHDLGHRDWVAPKPVSAGEINLVVAACYGKSETLKVESRPFDASVITMFPYNHGFVGDSEEGDDGSKR